LPFRDNFFGCLRFLLGNQSFSEKLTFCLLGVAKPQELIDDRYGSRWNVPAIGIELTGFKIEQCSFYKQGFDQNKIEDSQKVIEEILWWTNGQPFLTQKVCYLLVNKQINISKGEEKQIITQFVEDEIINKGINDDPAHLSTIQERILVTDEEKRSKLLVLYKNILEENIPANIDDILQQELRLTGVIIKQEEKLTVFNKIYEEVFNLVWINKELDNLRSHKYKEKINGWLKSNTWDENERERYYLLDGEEIKEAEDKYQRLSVEDEQFIKKSRTIYSR